MSETQYNRLVLEKVLDKDGSLVAKYKYTLGAAGERLKVEENDRTVEYEYDELYRLVKETVSEGENETVTEYTYDKNSNRLTKTVDDEVTSYTYNELNQLVSETGISYEYDLNGNLVKKTEEEQTTTYAYNAQNRLIRVTIQSGQQVNVEEYRYDYAGNRIAKIGEISTTYYLVDTNGALSQVLAEYDENGTLITSYTRADQLISQERDGANSYYLYDGFDSVRMLANDDGTVTDTYTFDAFGNLTSSTGDTINDFLYRGEQYDSFTGLYYLRARYMNPATGTFITMDEYAGSVFEPVSLHKYLYANANPVMYSDPSGYSSLGQMVATTAIVGIISGITTAAISIATFLGEGGKWEDINWGSVVLEALSSAFIGAAFGAAGWYAQFIQSAAIMTTLGFASLTSAAMSAIQAQNYEQQGNEDLADLYWFLYWSGVIGGVNAFNQACTYQNARVTANTTVNNSNSNTNTVDLPENTKVFKNKQVKFDDSLFDPQAVDSKGRTNVERMQNGLAPIGKDGQSVNIHHINQTNDGPVMEILASEHQANYSTLHSNTGQSPSQINRTEFAKWRQAYWKCRANDFL